MALTNIVFCVQMRMHLDPMTRKERKTLVTWCKNKFGVTLL